jgi:hypothetical protein
MNFNEIKKMAKDMGLKPVLDSPRITESVFKHDINHIDEHGKMA